MDPTTHTLTERWAWEPDQDVFVSALGDVDRREDGSTRVTLSTEGSMVEVDADGAERWRMSAGIGSMIGYSSRIEGFAPVASRP
jgi:hypothetical protein